MSLHDLRSKMGAQEFSAIPDATVLSAGRREPPPFPSDLFDGRLFQLAKDLADGASAPVDYVAAAILGAAAAAIGGTRRAQAFKSHKWTEPSILWWGLVGDPSSGKSPALDPVLDVLRSIEATAAGDHEQALCDWEADTLRAKLEREAWEAKVKDATKNGVASPSMPRAAVDPEKPARPRFVIMDTTPESVASILAVNPRLLNVRDELAGWFQGFDRYSPGGRQFWLEAFGGRPFVIDRKSNDKPLSIAFNGCSVVGGIQPDKLVSAALNGDDDGLPARFLWVWPRKVSYHRPTRIADEALLRDVIERLAGLRFGTNDLGEAKPIILPLDDAAADLFVDWRRENDTGAHDGGPLFKGFVGKLPGLVLRLALVVELLAWAERGGPEPETVSAATLARVCDFVDHYAKPMAMRVFGDAALPQAERNAATLARYILRTKADRLNLRTVRREARLPGLTDPAALAEAAALLVEARWLFETPTRAGETPGRKSKDMLVNPLVHEVDYGPVD
jgi:hypothetical protein